MRIYSFSDIASPCVILNLHYTLLLLHHLPDSNNHNLIIVASAFNYQDRDYRYVCISTSSVSSAGASAAEPGMISLGGSFCRKTSITSPSRILNFLDVLPFATSLGVGGPTIPMEVLEIVNSLSCCKVSRNACRPWTTSSSIEAGITLTISKH